MRNNTGLLGGLWKVIPVVFLSLHHVIKYQTLRNLRFLGEEKVGNRGKGLRQEKKKKKVKEKKKKKKRDQEKINCSLI